MDFFKKFFPDNLVESESGKKLIFAVGFIVFVIIAGYGIYSLFFKTALPSPGTISELATTTGFSGGLPQSEIGPGQIVNENKGESLNNVQSKNADLIAHGGITEIYEFTPSVVVDASLSSNNSSLQYYNPDDGKFYRINQAGEVNVLSDKVFNNVQNVTWSPNKNSAILEYPDGANVLFDFSSNKQTTLPKHWEDFNFSPSGNQIVMKSMGLDTENRWIAVANNDGSKARAIEPIGENNKIYPSWSPNNQIVAMYTEGTDFDRQEVFFLGLNDENYKSMTIEGRGFEPKWSPQGNKLVYSVYSTANNLKPMLWIAQTDGDNIGNGRKSLNLETWANKCVFKDENDIYCAAPANLENGSGLFPELAKSSPDQLYEINLITGSKKLVAVPNGEFNMSNLILADNDSYLYFTDENSKKIYKINLK